MSTSPRHVPLAEYVEGALDAAELATVDAHLRECAECRDEVRLARLGRAAARHAAAHPEQVPDGLHDRLMSGIGSPATVPASHRPRVLLAAAAALVLLGGIGTVVLRDPAPPRTTSVVAAQDNSVIDAAMTAFEQGQMPGGTAPQPAPDLSRLGLAIAGAGAGSLASQPVSAYAYSASGQQNRVVVYLSDRPFASPALKDAKYIPVPMHDLWVTWIPGAEPKLIVGTDEKLVHDVCELLL